MSTLVIKNLPNDLHDKLREQATRHHRSMTKEAVTLIEAGVNAQTNNGNWPGVAEPAQMKLTDYIGKWPRYKNIDEVNAWIDELRQDRDVEG